MPYLRDQQLEEFQDIRPAGGARVLLIDPPWSFEAYSEKGHFKGASAQYATMSMDEIKKMPIGHLAANDAVVFLWSTWPLMPHWNDVITAWGFEFKSLAWEWIKFNPDTGKYAFGPGYGTRKNLEPCLMATRGKPKMRPPIDMPLLGAGLPQGVRSVRDFVEAMPLDCIRQPLDGHSRKPDEQYTRIQTMFEGPYVELFARQRYPGWISWGFEVDKFEVRAAQ